MSKRIFIFFFFFLLWKCHVLLSYDYVHETDHTTLENIETTNDEVFNGNETTISYSSLIIEVPLFFSIISLTIRSSRIEQQDFYSVDILINSTCTIKRESNMTFIFQSSFDETKRCLSPLKHHGLITCEHFIYGVHYTIDGYLLCGSKNVSLSTKKELYEITKPMYFNSTNTPTSIDTFFFLPGLFHRLMIELTSVNQSCSLKYSTKDSPFYHCLFQHLPPAQWFVLTYYSLIDNHHHQATSNGLSIVYTDVEDLHFSCQLNGNNQQIDFHWTNLTGFGYSNLTISVLTEENEQLWIIICDPYTSQVICSTKQYRLEAGREYNIVAKLKKIIPNYNGQKSEICSIKTNLSQIPVNSIRHEFVNETTVWFSWLEHPFHVQTRLRNLETNLYEYPIENNPRTALFVNLAEASIYQLELNISKINWTPLLQMTNYHIQTDFQKLIIENILRPSEKTLIVHLNRDDMSMIKFIYCIEQLTNDSIQLCSLSNIFTQLHPGTIYNISVSIHRDSFQNRFLWKKHTVFKLVNTNPSSLRIRSWKTDEHNCAAELFNTFPLSYSSECLSNGRILHCQQLQCGCQYQFHISFNQTNINSLCLTSPCDIQLNHPNFTIVQFQTPLETIRNLRIVSISPILREIEVDFDLPLGCFDRWILICEERSMKQRKSFMNSTICTDLISEEFYRIYVEIKRTGWETMISEMIEIQLILIPNINEDINKRSFVQSVIIPSMIGILLIILFVALVLTYRQRRQKHLTKQDNPSITTIHNKTTTTTTKLNHIVNQVHIYPHSKAMHPTDSKKHTFVSRPIRIKDLPIEYEQLIANNYYNISDEFHKLRTSLQDRSELVQCDQLFNKNRYKDILPYEHSRVQLIPMDECDSGYINASFITGLHNPREYIACQGPLKTTVNDHWQMIWEQHVRISVMLTENNERGINKCARYWPVNLNEVEMFGHISVSITECVNVNSYDLRLIQLKKNDEIRSLKHYAFKMWDDHTVPTNSDILIDFIRLIRLEYHPQCCHGPMLVHCSAGVGRSGTFIALDRLLQQFDKVSFYGHLDIYGTVLDMRRCRDKMVQNEHQYLFIYRCLKEEYEKRSGNTNYAVIADDLV